VVAIRPLRVRISWLVSVIGDAPYDE